MCVYRDLLNSKWGTDFLSSEDYGALSHDFRQLEGIQPQQLTGIGNHWKHGQRHVKHLERFLCLPRFLYHLTHFL